MEDEAKTIFGVVIIAGLGGLVHWIRHPKGKWVTLIRDMITAAFAGLLAHYVTSWLGFDLDLQFFISGAAGYGGGILLDNVVRRVRGIINSGGDMLEEAAKRIKEKKK